VKCPERNLDCVAELNIVEKSLRLQSILIRNRIKYFSVLDEVEQLGNLDLYSTFRLFCSSIIKSLYKKWPHV